MTLVCLLTLPLLVSMSRHNSTVLFLHVSPLVRTKSYVFIFIFEEFRSGYVQKEEEEEKVKEEEQKK